jgi:hypothetical protein
LNRRNTVIAVAVVLAACSGVDRILEGVPPPTDGRISTIAASSSIAIVRGGEQTLTATINRTGGFTGPVTLTVEQLPQGVNATVGQATGSGTASTFTISIRADLDAQMGSFAVLLRGHGDQVPDASAAVTLTITERPQFSLALSKDALIIARGGIDRAIVNVARVNLIGDVTLALQGASGITASFAASPLTGDTTTATISVAATVAPGTYNLTLRGTSPGALDRSIPLTIVVTADPLQLIAPTSIAAAQGSIYTADLIVNKTGATGPITIVAEGLPPGATATFDLTAPIPAMRLTVPASVPAANYSVVIRASSPGVPDATFRVALNVIASSIEVVLSPSSVAVFQGSSTTTSVSITRTVFTGAVALSIDNPPSGITIASQPSPVTGTGALLTITATSTAPEGQFNVVVRAAPVGSEIGPTQTTTMTLIVRAAPTGAGNVLLDWSGCTAPTWVAYQDGSAEWTRSQLASGAARFSVSSTRGGFAYVDGDTALTVRYLTRAELTAGPIAMCPGAGPPTKTVNGTAEHAAINEVFTWSLGGGTTTSTQAAPAFRISGVRAGANDFVGWGATLRAGVRGLIRRDQNIADGGSVGVVDLANEGFAPPRAIVTIVGTLTGEQWLHSMTYLTTAACTANPLYSTPGAVALMYGFPDSLQRPDDYHMISVSGLTATSARTSSYVFHTMTSNRNYALPTAPTSPAVATGPGAFKRLVLTIASVPSMYNQNVFLNYRDGRNAMTVIASIAYTTNVGINLSIPDLSGVSGFPLGAVLASNASGRWTAGADGTRTSGSLCSEGAGTNSWRLTGVF